jgi:type I restriction enzyme S subunit
MARLGEVCIVNPKGKTLSDELEVSFVPMQNVSEDGNIDITITKKYCDVKKGFTTFENGDILFAKITPCMENGKGGIARHLKNGIGFGSTEFHVLRPDLEVVTSEWIYYLTTDPEFRKRCEKNMTGSAGQKRVPKSFLETYEFSLPSLNEQRRIAAILDKVTSLIALRKQQLALLDELVKARFVEMFGDPVQNTKHFPTVKMGEACYLKAGITTSADEIHDYSDKYSVPCYGGNGIRGYVKSHTYDGVFPIIGRQGALCGNVQLAAGKFHATEHAVLVTPLKGQNSIWLYYLLKYFDLNRFQTGAAQPGLSVKALNAIDIMMPEIDAQNQFAQFSSQQNDTLLVIQYALDILKSLRVKMFQCFF